MWEAIRVTLALAAVTTPLLLVLATPLAWWLSQGRDGVRDCVGALTALPLVLPPTVLGFYLLMAMGPQSPLLWVLRPFGIETLAFSFTGLVIGSLFYSLPFAVQPVRNAFEALGRQPLEMAKLLGASRRQTFFRIILPLSQRGFITAAILVFAHTIGEFGVVLMIGGSLPGKTEVLSIRIYQAVEQLNWNEAHILSLGLMIFAFLILLSLLRIDRRTCTTES